MAEHPRKQKGEVTLLVGPFRYSVSPNPWHATGKHIAGQLSCMSLGMGAGPSCIWLGALSKAEMLWEWWFGDVPAEGLPELYKMVYHEQEDNWYQLVVNQKA